MCGIFGYFNVSAVDPLDGHVLHGMGSVIRHRGPDDRGVHEDLFAALGNQRLSIIDIEGGHQPFVSDDGSIVVVQNGEIFNFVELADDLRRTGHAPRTKSDTEVLLRLFEREGISFVDKLNGMFAIAILDKRTQKLYLVRDRVGVKPLYVAEHDGRLLFGSEIKSILAAGHPRNIDPLALDRFLCFNYVPPPRTIFEGIAHVQPGHYLEISRGEVVDRAWWELADRAQSDSRHESSWREEFLAIIDDAVRIRLRADVPFGAFLSGGVDSSTVVAFMSRRAEHQVRTFCIGFDDPQYDESRYAEDAARRFGTRHIMERVNPDMLGSWSDAIWHCDQPHGDISFLPTLRVSQLAAQDVKMVLTGDGGDELFAGYEKYSDFFSTPGVGSLSESGFRDAYSRQITLFGREEREDLFVESMQRQVGGDHAEHDLTRLFDDSAGFDRINRALYIDTQWLLPGNNLVKPDRMGMAVSLEARTPFLDYRMVEFAFSMPGALKLKDGQTKAIYKSAVSPIIGQELAYRAKQMFTVPVGDWLRGRLYPWAHELLLGASSNTQEYFRKEAVQRYLEAHRDGSRNHTREIRALLAFELWSRRFMSGYEASRA